MTRTLMEWWPLAVLWGAVAGVLGGAVVAWWCVRELRTFRSSGGDTNVLRLPPSAVRSGPTHVVRCSQARPYDHAKEPA